MNDAESHAGGQGLTLDHVTAGYNRLAILREINLTIAYGSFTALVGPNGSGKSTLLKTIVGILPTLAGEIRFDPLAGQIPRIGFVPQRETLDPGYPLSNFDVALMGAYGRVASGRFIPMAERDFAMECLRTAGVADISHERFARASGGQTQRVLIARALVARPHILVLDEPTAGVDAAGSIAMMELAERLHREQQMTILMVNHDVRAVRRYAREAIWLQRGTAFKRPVSDLAKPETIEELLD